MSPEPFGKLKTGLPKDAGFSRVSADRDSWFDKLTRLNCERLGINFAIALSLDGCGYPCTI